MEDYNQSMHDYLEDKKMLYHSIIEFLESSNDPKDENYAENSFKKLQKIVKTQQVERDPEELEQFLQITKCIFNNHHRERNFIDRFQRILLHYKDSIKQTLSNEKLYAIFEDNKFILLYLMKNNIIEINEQIYNSILNKIEPNGTKYCHFFYPELEKFAGPKKMEKVKKDLSEILNNFDYKTDFSNILDSFDIKRQEGENDLYICSLIRQDSVEEFIAYINRSNLPISSSIPPSIFETNSFLIKNKDTSLIEYSAFFGSIQIFQYLLMNKAELTPSLWLYSIHSKNAELIHLLESNRVHPPKNENDDNNDDDFTECLIESVKCHHNDIADYIENNLLPSTFSRDNEKFISKYLKYHNYSYFLEESISNQGFFYLVFYNYNKLLNFSLKHPKLTIQEAVDMNDTKSIYCLLLKENTIKDDLFKNNSLLKKIAIPPTITKIDHYAFFSCASLTHVFIPNSVKSIGNDSFKVCSSLKKIMIPSSVTLIGYSSFRQCSSLKKLSIPSSVTSIDGLAFYSCSSLKEISIPPSINIINISTFRLCKSLEQISIPSSVIKIDRYAFSGCSSLKKVIIPSSVKSIAYNAFSYCSSLEQVKIPSSVESIEEDAFYSCSALKDVTIPSSFTNLKRIGIQINSNITYLK